MIKNGVQSIENVQKKSELTIKNPRRTDVIVRTRAKAAFPPTSWQWHHTMEIMGQTFSYMNASRKIKEWPS